MTSSTATALAIDKTFTALFKRYIPRSNIVFLSFCPKISNAYGKDADGFVGDTIYMPSILRIPTAKFENLPYNSFTSNEELHIAGGILLNIFKSTSTTYVDRKFEIADVRFHTKSMITNVMIDSLDSIENNLITQALNQLTKINAIGGTATGKTYLGGKITERTIKDEIALDTILLNNNARFLTERISGSLRFGTSPVPLSFIEITSVEAGQEIISTYEGSGKFVTAVEYGMDYRSAEAVNSQRFETGYIRGSNRRIFVTKNFPKLEQQTVDGGTDRVYHSLILAADAFYIYQPSNRFIETKSSSNQFTATDLSADKIRFNVKLTYGLTQEVYGHALHFLYLGKQTT